MLIRLAAAIYENPKEGWRLLYLLAGVIVSFCIAGTIYFFIGLFERISGKDLLNAQHHIDSIKKRR